MGSILMFLGLGSGILFIVLLIGSLFGRLLKRNWVKKSFAGALISLLTFFGCLVIDTINNPKWKQRSR